MDDLSKEARHIITLCNGVMSPGIIAAVETRLLAVRREAIEECESILSTMVKQAAINANESLKETSPGFDPDNGSKLHHTANGIEKARLAIRALADPRLESRLVEPGAKEGE